MKEVLTKCVISFIVLTFFAFTLKKQTNDNSIYGVWSEYKANTDSIGTFQIAFYPGGKVNVIRKNHNYVGYYKIRTYQTNYMAGDMTIGQHFPFTVAFLTPKKIKLSINYNDHKEVRYLQKTKNVKSGFLLIDSAGRGKS